MQKPPTPRTGAGWLWAACAVLAGYMFVLNGGNTRSEFVAGWNEGTNPAPTAEIASGTDS